MNRRSKPSAETQGDGFDPDAWLRETDPGGFDPDAWLRETDPGGFDPDAWLRKTAEAAGLVRGAVNSLRRGLAQAASAGDMMVINRAERERGRLEAEIARQGGLEAEIAERNERARAPLNPDAMPMWKTGRSPAPKETSPEEAAVAVRRRDAVVRSLQGQAAAHEELERAKILDIAERHAKADALPQSEGKRAFDEAKGLGDALRALARDPLDVISGVAVESLAASLPALALGAAGSVGGPAGTAAGAGAGSLAMEYASTLLDELRQAKGVDFNQPDTVLAHLRKPGVMDALRAKALKRGVPVAAFDAMSAGVAGRLFRKPAATLLGKAGKGAAEMGIQAGLGGAGEAAGGLAAEGKVDWKAVLAEALGEVGSGAGEVVTGAVRDRVSGMTRRGGDAAEGPGEPRAGGPETGRGSEFQRVFDPFAEGLAEDAGGGFQGGGAEASPIVSGAGDSLPTAPAPPRRLAAGEDAQFARRLTGDESSGNNDPRHGLPQDTAPDAFTGIRSHITGGGVSAAQALRLAERARSLSLRAAEPDAGGTSGVDELGLPKIGFKRVDGGLVGPGGVSLEQIGAGAEADVYADPARGVVYKVFSKGSRGSQGQRFTLASNGMAFRDTGNRGDVLEKAWVINALGGAPTEVVGLTLQNEVVTKQPLGSLDATWRPRAVNREARLVEIPPAALKRPEGMGELYLAHIDGHDFIVGDLHEGNYIGDTLAQGRIADLVAHRLGAAELERAPGLRDWIAANRETAQAPGPRDFARRTPEQAVAARDELAALQARWRVEAERIAPGVMRRFRLEFGAPSELAAAGRASQRDLTGREEAAYLASERMFFLFDDALRSNPDAVTRANLLHEMGHAHWDTLPGPRQAELLDLWREEVDNRRGPLFTGKKLRAGVALGVERNVKEWYAERVAWENQEWARHRAGEVYAVRGMAGRMAQQFRIMLAKLRDFYRRLRGGDAINVDFRRFLDQGGRLEGRAAPEVVRPGFARRDGVSQAEYAAVVSQWTNPDGTRKPGWLKALNGRPTKLTERQWVQVRTPAFKRWFGDWEAAAEMPGRAKSFDEARAILAPLVGRVFTNRNSGLQGSLSKNSIDKILSGKSHTKSVSMAAHLHAAANIINLFERGEVLQSEPGKKGEVKTSHKVFAPFVFEGQPLVAKVTVHEYTRQGGNRIYSVEAMEILNPAVNSAPVGFDQQSNPLPDSVMNRLREMAESVKLESVSKVVDENGEPLQLAHGTRADFDTFQPSKRFGNMFFFTQYSSDARIYAGKDARIVKVFLALRNPKIIAASEYSRDALLDANEAGRYDGLLARDETGFVKVAVVFDNTNIKSATGNSGAFAAGNPDIYFARRAPLPGGAKDRGKAAREWVRRWFTSAGGMPAAAWKAKVDKSGRLTAITKMAGFAVRDLDRAVHAVYGGYGAMTPAQLRQIDDVLGGRLSPDVLDARLRAPIGQMRLHIDTLSRRLVREGVVDGELAARIDGNIGFYLHRSYRKFDDPNWAKKVPREVYNRAASYVDAELRARNGGQPVDPERVRGVLGEILNTDSPAAFFTAPGDRNSMDLRIFTKRKEIAPEIRELMGEYHDPRVNYLRSVTKAAQVLETHGFLQQTRRAGLAQGWLRADAYGDMNTPIAAEGSKVMEPLAGLYTTPEIARAFNQQLDDFGNHVWRWWLRVNGLAKVSKTVLSPMTQTRNLAGNVGFLVANGHWRADAAREVWTAVRADLGLGRGGDTPAARDYVARLARLGIIGESVNAGELREALNDAGGRMGEIEPWVDGRLKRAAKAPFQVAARLYQLNDEIFKIYAFENERRAWAAAEPAWSAEQVDRIAAERVRNTLPTYSLIPRAGQAWRRVGLTGSFLSFPSEVARVTYHTIGYAFKDLASGNPRVKLMGAKRLAGLITVATLPAALSALTRWLAGVDGDDEKDLRRYLPEWNRNADLYHLGNDGKGRFKLVDASYLDPWNYFKKPLTAALNGDSLQQAAMEAGREALEPFGGEGLVTKLALDLARNRDDQGRQIANPQESLTRRAGDYAGHAWRTFAPGFHTQGRRIFMGATGRVEAKSGRAYDLDSEIGAVATGARSMSLDVGQGLRTKAKRFAGARREAELIFTEVRDRKGTVTAKERAEAKQRMEAARRKLHEDLSRDIAAAKRLGVDDAPVLFALKAAGISDADVLLLMGGQYRPYVDHPFSRMKRGMLELMVDQR